MEKGKNKNTKLINHFINLGTLHYESTEIDTLSDMYADTAHLGAHAINKLLLQLSKFLGEIHSRWNQKRDKTALQSILNDMATAIKEFKTQIIKINLSKEDAPEAFQSALDYCQKTISGHLLRLKKQHANIADIYEYEENDLRRMHLS